MLLDVMNHEMGLIERIRSYLECRDIINLSTSCTVMMIRIRPSLELFPSMWNRYIFYNNRHLNNRIISDEALAIEEKEREEWRKTIGRTLRSVRACRQRLIEMQPAKRRRLR